MPLTGKFAEYRTFFTTAVRNPRMVGAATPTSSAVAATVAQVVPSTGNPVVVELGPGTGSLSDGIHARLPAGARHLGIELGADLVAHLRDNKPWLEVVHGDAGELKAVLADRGIDRVDAVISSIPWSLLDDPVQGHILDQVTQALAPHGAFTALTYLPAERTRNARRFRERLHESFDEVLTHTTWRNFPPILHYLCRRPLA
ncbi:SAM-dependent methyltransferase [Saccharopolyspora sp. TS4A08]|uniref:SAM-dependent methyltransferase n=1 Tax=Saccharopolyspora ipomoeae TaxID=3042027 RepID=A0ABT6PLZ0_9PSEU|nr:methyltransferase domain-containing protein [Saccharopolyspora sp. TS4A08]MDI2029024.1 SAM-dependent methyltransferase [Saccharopolyspora sp. TS4A08]